MLLDIANGGSVATSWCGLFGRQLVDVASLHDARREESYGTGDDFQVCTLSYPVPQSCTPNREEWGTYRGTGYERVLQYNI
jgi:hypothetical protein